MFHNIIKSLYNIHEFRIRLRDFYLTCENFIFHVNEKFFGKVSNDGKFHILSDFYLETYEPVTVQIHKDMHIYGKVIVDDIFMKDRQGNLHKIFINDEFELNSHLV